MQMEALKMNDMLGTRKRPLASTSGNEKGLFNKLWVEKILHELRSFTLGIARIHGPEILNWRQPWTGPAALFQ